MSGWWSKYHKVLYGFLIAMQATFITLNLAQGDPGLAGLNVACLALVFLAECYVNTIEARRQQKCEELRTLIVQARLQNIEDAEKHYMNLLQIWGGDPP